MLNLKYIIKSARMMKQCGEMLDVALDRHDNIDHRNYVPSGVFREPITPYDEAHGTIVVDIHYSDGKDGEVRVVQK